MDPLKVDQLLRHNEDVRCKMYYDTKGIPTIGVGMNLLTETLPDDLAYEWSQRKRTRIINDLHNRLDFFSSLDDVRQAALVDMAYNMGADGLLAFGETLEMIRNKQYVEAAKHLETTPYYHEVGLRSARICKMISTGLWPDFIK